MMAVFTFSFIEPLKVPDFALHVSSAQSLVASPFYRREAGGDLRVPQLVRGRRDLNHVKGCSFVFKSRSLVKNAA